MKRIKALLVKPWFAYIFAACVGVTLYIVLTNIPALLNVLSKALSFMSPVIIGVIIAYLLNPVSNFFEAKVFGKVKKEATRHTFGVILTLICFVLIIVLLLVALVPSLIQSVSKLVSNWESYMTKIEELFTHIEKYANKLGVSVSVASISAFIENSVDKLFNFVKNNTDLIKDKVASIGTGISNAAIGLVFGFCFLAAKKTLVGVVMRVRYAVIKKERADRNDKIWKKCHSVFLSYIGCTLLDALIIGVTVLVLMLLFRLPYAPLIAVIVAVTNIIPTVGPMIGGGIGIFFLILDKPINALWFLIMICAIQALDGLVIKPRLFSGSLGIPAVWTLVLIILGGKVGGMLGILLSIPFAAIVVILYNEIFVPRLERRTEKINKSSGS